MDRAREIDVEVVGKEQRQSVSRLESDPMVALVARLMDSVFSIPGTNIRFGLDPILGLLPGFGDTATAIVSVMLIAQSARYGVPRVVLARMAGNVLINTALGSIPFLGDAFSVWFKSNARNYDLLRKHAGVRREASWRDWTFVLVLLGVVLALVALIIVGVITLLGALFKGE